MSVQTHLTTTASNLILTDEENDSIAKSITTLQKRLKEYFGESLKDHFMFGSNTRGTILPRKVDSNSDIDYMLIFDNSSGQKPQSFLDRVKRFAEKKYSTSEIYQSHPTIVLELNHIKFELVPAYIQLGVNGYYIPKKGNFGDEWMLTNPNEINKRLTDKNTSHSSLIKPLVRLLKYWNATNKVYSSFKLEEYVIQHYYSSNNLKNMFYTVVDGLQTSHLSQNGRNKVDRLKKIINETREYEKKTEFVYAVLAEMKIKEVIPQYKQ